MAEDNRKGRFQKNKKMLVGYGCVKMGARQGLTGETASVALEEEDPYEMR